MAILAPPVPVGRMAATDTQGDGRCVRRSCCLRSLRPALLPLRRGRRTSPARSRKSRRPAPLRSGTTNIKQTTEIGAQKGLNLNILAAKDHAEAFLMVETGRAAAFVMDDILLYSLVAGSKAPQDYVISADALSVEPYGIMLRREDPDFKTIVDGAMVSIYKSGEINGIYEKWFLKPIPPKGINLNLPMSAAFKKVVASPTDSGD